MIFGKTSEEKGKQQRITRLRLRKKEEEGWVIFAWLPVTLTDGRTIWLEKYHTSRGHYKNAHARDYDPYSCWTKRELNNDAD